MAYALQSMLKIRAKREERASTELTAARRARNAAEEERDRRQDEADEFNRTKDERRDRIYDAVIGHVVNMDSLDSARDAVTQIDEEAMMLEEARDKAQQLLEQRESEAESARIRYVAASKNKMKIEQHKAAWEEEELRELERRSDLELEEFAGRKLTSDDDDSID